MEHILGLQNLCSERNKGMTLPNSQQYEDLLTSALEAAMAGGKILQKHWGKLSVIEQKNPGDLVTIADRESENVIIDLLHERYPDHAFLAEESGARFAHTENIEEKFTWAIDPLDGTTNYTHQFPIFSVSIALLYGSMPIIGVIYNPIVGELFHAIKGQGAYLDGQPIKVSEVKEVSESLLVTGFSYDRRVNPDNNFEEFFKLTILSQGVRRMGSAALDLAYVAAGRFDGYWERGLKPWDMAAGVLLVQEAGGLVTDYNKAPFDLYSGRILATNGHLHIPLSEALMK